MRKGVKINGRQPLVFEILDNLGENFDTKNLNKLKEICNNFVEENKREQV
jgi:hypothetical protein